MENRGTTTASSGEPGGEPTTRRIERREPGIFALLNLVTIGFYSDYLAYRWAEDLNALLGRRKYDPAVVLVFGLLTCTIGFSVFAIAYAYDLERIGQAAGDPQRGEHLGSYVLILILLAMVISVFTGGLALLLSMVIWVSAFWLIQNEINGLR